LIFQSAKQQQDSYIFGIMAGNNETLALFFNGRYIDYLSLTYATNKSGILKVTL